MSEYTEGELGYSVLDGTQTPATLFVKHDGDDIDIAVFEKWEQDWAKKEMEAYATELVRRWNAHKDLAHELEEADKIIEYFLHRDQSEPIAPDLRTAERKAALAQAVEEK